MNLDLRDIVKKWLQENNYDGLYNSECCACLVGDLMPCGEPSMRCSPGYKKPCPPEGCEWCPADGGCDWHVGSGEDGAS